MQLRPCRKERRSDRGQCFQVGRQPLLQRRVREAQVVQPLLRQGCDDRAEMCWVDCLGDIANGVRNPICAGEKMIGRKFVPRFERAAGKAFDGLALAVMVVVDQALRRLVAALERDHGLVDVAGPGQHVLNGRVGRGRRLIDGADQLGERLAKALAVHVGLIGVREREKQVLLETLDTGGVWSVARGLARNETSYKGHLQACDAERRNDLDGRGALSEEALAEFTRFFLDTCLDQVRFMEQLVQPDRLRERILRWAAEESDGNRLPAKAGAVLEALLYRGELPRGDVSALLDLTDRHARRVVRVFELRDREAEPRDRRSAV